MMSPDKQQELATDAMHGWQRWWQYVTEPARQSSDPVRPLAQDKRFSDPAWSAWPWHQQWQGFLPYVDPDNWQARVPQTDGSWWPAWEGRLTRHAGSNVAPPAPLANAAPAPGNYVLQV